MRSLVRIHWSDRISKSNYRRSVPPIPVYCGTLCGGAIDSAGGVVLAIAHRSRDAPQALMPLMLNNSINYLAFASIIRFSRLVSPFATDESSALPGSGVAHETSNQTARPKLLNQVRIVLRSRYYSQRIKSAYPNWIKLEAGFSDFVPYRKQV